MDAKASLLNLAPSALRRAAEIKERIDELSEELSRILSGSVPVAENTGTGKRKMSAAGRARIAAAARARWAKVRSGASPTGPEKKKRTMSAAAKAKIAAAARARWAKIKAAKSR